MGHYHIKQVIRKLSRNKIYSGINIIGLTVAITAALLIYSHVTKEFKTDHFHQNRENIYRVLSSGIFNSHWSNSMSQPFGPACKKEITGVRDYVRITYEDFHIKTENTTDFIKEQECIIADPQFFSIFNFPLTAGKVTEETGSWVVISEKAAFRYFGEENPIGKTLRVKESPQSDENPQEYQIAGIMKNIPSWSTIQGDFVFNLKQQEDAYWGNWGTTTFLLLEPNCDTKNIEAGIVGLYDKYFLGAYKAAFPDSNPSQLSVLLQPLSQVYFNSEFVSDQQDTPRGAKGLSYILCGVTLLIFVLAIINYLTIKMAQLSKNLPDYAIQKCYGARQKDFIHQLQIELGLHIGIASVLTIGLVYLLHPYFIGIISPLHPYNLHLTITEITTFIVLLTCMCLSIIFSLYFFIEKESTKAVSKTQYKRQAGNGI